MKTSNIFLTALLFLYCTSLSAQYAPESFIKNYPQIATLENLKSNPSDNNTPNQYRVIATRGDRWDLEQETWYHFDTTETTYFESGRVAEWLYMRWYDGILENNWRASYQYNNNNQLLSHIRESWAGTDWGFLNGDFREIYTYDASNEISYISAFWDQTSWRESFSRTTSYYVGTNLPDTIFLEYDYDGEPGLDNGERRSYAEYNEDGEELIWYIESWDLSTMDWESPYRYEETYDENGRRILQERSIFSNGSWEPNYQSIYTYNNDGLRIEDRGLIWLSDEQEWREDRLSVFEYDANGNLILYESSNYSPQQQALELTFRAINEFDENGNLIEYRVLATYITGELENLANYEFTYYDDIGKQATELYQEWNIETQEWENRQHLTYYYDIFLISDVEENPLQQPLFSLSPNPADDIIQISFEEIQDLKNGVNIQLIDAKGMLVKQVEIWERNSQLNVDDIAPGIYWIRVGNDGQSSIPIVIK